MSSIRFKHHVVSILIVAFAALGTGVPARAQSSHLTIVNADDVPFPDRLVFSRIGSLDDSLLVNGVHDVGKIRIKNMENVALVIESLVVEGPFKLENPPDLPLVILAGGSADVNIRYIAEFGDWSGERRGLHTGLLSISSSTGQASASIDLVGYWQKKSESGLEPTLSEIVTQVFGYSTEIAYPGEKVNNHGVVKTTGEEVLSSYWKVADPATPVHVRALASFYRCCTDAVKLSWYEAGNPIDAAPILTIDASNLQTVLPLVQEGDAATGFAPSASSTFGFVAMDTVWSDPLLNDVSLDDCSHGRQTCGHRIRFWPARNAFGMPIPSTYIMAAELSSHGDFNDAVFLLSNITPSTGSVGVAVERDGEIPSTFALQSYPNPFNPSTVIRYTLPSMADVRLDVYDATGRHVASLVQGDQQAGEHRVTFDASGLTSGVYVSRLRAGDRAETHALLLIR